MRTYTAIRFGSHLRYAEVASSKTGNNLYHIPKQIPRLLDPMILWKSTIEAEKKGVNSVDIHDKSGDAWFQIKSKGIPLDKLISYSESVGKYMF